MITSAAQELAKLIAQKADECCYRRGVWEEDLIRYSTAIITAALKRCRNEALEEAAILTRNSGCDFAIDEANDIRNFKDTFDV